MKNFSKMGNNGAQIKRPYYDKYFGPKYFQTIGDDLGPNGNMFFDLNNLQQQQIKPYYMPNPAMPCEVPFDPVTAAMFPVSGVFNGVYY